MGQAPAQSRLALTAPPLPASAEPHPVDKFIDDYFRRNGMAMPATVSRELFARRAYLDAWGLLPAPEQLAQAGSVEGLVEGLLAHGENYTHHWITFWNDHLRNDEGVVYHGDRKSITPWLRGALRQNLPYDQFLQALLNPTAKTDPDGFLTGVNWRGEANASQTPVMQAAQNSAQVFLGVNLKCNSCHDSFISKWKLADAYGLASFFSEQPLVVHRCDAPTGAKAGPRFLFPELGSVDGGAPLGEKRAAAARLFTMPENGRTPRTLVNRFWKVLFGRGLVEPADEMDTRAWHPELLDWLAADFVSHGWDMKHLLRRLMTSRAYRLVSTREEPATPFVFRGPLPRRLSAEQFLDAVSSITGEWRTLDPRGPGKAVYARDWQLKSSPLGRSLGRPIRDQVATERITQPTTLQALEMANGATLASLVERGSKRLLGVLGPAHEPLFDSGVVTKHQIDCDIEVTGARRLWLVLVDVDSYDPARVAAWWKIGEDRRPAPVPSTRTLDLAPGATRFQARVGVDAASLASDINPRVRFFVYRDEPDPRRYFAIEGEPPVPRSRAPVTLDRVYLHALARAPSPAERKILGPLDEANLEDALWALFLSPEFQFVR